MSITESTIRDMVRRLLSEAGYEEAAEMDAAQPEVRAAVDRYLDMSPEERDPVLLYWLLGSGTPPYKMSKEDSHYADDTGTAEQACLNCEYLYQKVPTGEYVCSQIRGQVRPEGWCSLWEVADVYGDQ